jgi:hypothetical protein
MSVTALLALAITGVLTTAPLLIAVAAAVLSGNPQRRADARRVVRMLRPPHPRRLPSEETSPQMTRRRLT